MITQQQIMEQAQVFASAWSLVGGRFDFGNGMENAEEAKAELAAMVAKVFEQGAQPGADVAGLMALHDAHGSARWETGYNEAIKAKAAATQSDKAAQKARAALESALRVALAQRDAEALTDDELRAEVRSRIEHSGLTQENYAMGHGYSPQYLSDFLNGKRKPGPAILEGENMVSVTRYANMNCVPIGPEMLIAAAQAGAQEPKP